MGVHMSHIGFVFIYAICMDKNVVQGFEVNYEA